MTPAPVVVCYVQVQSMEGRQFWIRYVVAGGDADAAATEAIQAVGVQSDYRIVAVDVHLGLGLAYTVGALPLKARQIEVVTREAG